MKKIVVCCIYFIALQNYAQFTSENEKVIDSTHSFLEITEFKLGYFGNSLWNPGLSSGAEYLIREKVRIKERKRGNKTISNQLLLNGNLGFYWDPRSHVGVFTNYGITWRRTNNKGKQISVEFNPLGYERSFLPETYEVKNGEVDKVFLPGRSYYAPSLSLGFGRLRKGKKLTASYFNINFKLLTPYNTGSLPQISFNYGYRFKLKKKNKHQKDEK